MKLGLAHRLMTPYTSLVAVDGGVANLSGPATPVEVPVELPSGVSREGIFGAREEMQRKVSAASVAHTGGVVGGVAGGVQGGILDRSWRKEAGEPVPASAVPPAPWTTILWRTDDGHLVTLERGRLAPGKRAELDRLLAAIPANAWGPPMPESNLTVVTGEGPRSILLPATHPAALRALVEAVARAAQTR